MRNRKRRKSPRARPRLRPSRAQPLRRPSGCEGRAVAYWLGLLLQWACGLGARSWQAAAYGPQQENGPFACGRKPCGIQEACVRMVVAWNAHERRLGHVGALCTAARAGGELRGDSLLLRWRAHPSASTPQPARATLTQNYGPSLHNLQTIRTLHQIPGPCRRKRTEETSDTTSQRQRHQFWARSGVR